MSKELVLETLQKSGEPMRPGQIAEAAGIEKLAVDKAIKELKAEGKVDSPKRCFYVAV
jgi:Predicted transcriptional regulator